jgi:D-alanyl-D-alanine carboxypeptidase
MRVLPVISLSLALLVWSPSPLPGEVDRQIRPDAGTAPAASTTRRRPVRPIPSELLAAIDAIAADAIAGGSPGLAITVQLRGGLLLHRAYGLENRITNVPLSDRTIQQIGSVTKQMTAAAIMRLVEEGRVELSDPLSRYVPEVQSAGLITIEQLLNHTSGLPNYTSMVVDAFRPVSTTQVVAMINSAPMLASPGTVFLYNNSGYYILGMVIERITGQSYADYLHHEFFVPLGMSSTAYCGEPPAFPLPEGHVQFVGAAPVPVESIDMSIAFAAGAVCSTTPDLHRWAVSLATGTVVSPESFAAMTAPTRLSDGTLVPFYGYGLAMDTLLGHRRIGHGGSILGFKSHLSYFPDAGLTVAVLSNVTPLDNRDHAFETGNRVARLMLGRL